MQLSSARNGLALAFALVLGLAPVGAAHAQGSASEVALARAQFNEGVAASREGRWEDALAAFTRSYEVAPRGVTLFNLAGAQAQVGHLVQASESYRRFVATAEPRDRERYGAQAETALAALEPRIAHVTIAVDGLETADSMTLDGAALGRATLGLDMPIDPGAHVVEVVRAGASVAREEIALEEGQRATLSLDARPRVVVATPTEAAEAAATEPNDDAIVAPPQSGSDDTGLVIGLVAGGVALVAVAVIVGVVVGTSSSAPAPFQGSLMPGSIVIP